MRLEVFQTTNCGWGVRCVDDIPSGTFICTIAGDLLTAEKANEADGQYLVDLDCIENAERARTNYEIEFILKCSSDACPPILSDLEQSSHHTRSKDNVSRLQEEVSSNFKSVREYYSNNNEECFSLEAKNIGRYFNVSKGHSIVRPVLNLFFLFLSAFL